MVQQSWAQALKIPTTRGAVLEAIADFPNGDGPFATVILASGGGYHMELPAIEQTAKQLVARGFGAVRFNWAYYTADPKTGHPSEKFANELEDMAAVLAAARKDGRVNPQQIFVGGKSLGTGIAWKLFTNDTALRGAVLLTPICSHLDGNQIIADGGGNYPGLARERRPVLLISGDHDPNCAPRELYKFSASAGGPTRVAIVSGNHGFENPELPPDEAAVAKLRNVRLVGELVADFVAGSL